MRTSFSADASERRVSPSKVVSALGIGTVPYFDRIIPNSSFVNANPYFLIHCLPTSLINYTPYYRILH